MHKFVLIFIAYFVCIGANLAEGDRIYDDDDTVAIEGNLDFIG